MVIAISCQAVGLAEQWRAVGLGPPVSDISNGTYTYVPYTFERHHMHRPLILGFTTVGHDMGFVATLGSEVLAALELERYHKIRYFDLRVLSGMNENFGSIDDLCQWVMDHRQKDCIEVLASMEPEPDEDEYSFEVRALKRRERVLYENAMERYIKPALQQLCHLVHRKMRDLGEWARDLDPGGSCQIQYDIAVSAATNQHASQYNTLMLDLVKPYVQATEWHLVDHHHAHAAVAWLDSPFYRRKGYSSLILSYDGGGSDGNLRMFLGESGDPNLKTLVPGQPWHSFGNVYEAASSLVRDLAWGTPYGSKPPCPYGKKTACQLALPGSFMAFAAIGNVRDEWRPGARLFIRRGLWNAKLWPSPFGGECTLRCFVNESSVYGGDPDWWYRYASSGQAASECLDSAYTRRGVSYSGWTRYYFACDNSDLVEKSQMIDRDFAATIQDEFDQVMLSVVHTKLDVTKLQPNSLVITGGCALNVKTNTALARGLNLPAHVPPAPGDNGIPLGAAWLLHPPPADQRMDSQGAGIQFSGAPLTDVQGKLLMPSDIDLEQVRAESQQRLTEATQAALAAQGQLSALPTIVREMGQTLQDALKGQSKELAEAVKRTATGDKGKLVLVDTKGLGKPSTFSGDAEQFLPWRHRMLAYICSIYPELREALEWCEEREKAISTEELTEAYGEKADEIDRIPNLLEKSTELSSALQMVTAKEPFAIVINCSTNGFEAWRRLARRYDPSTASRKRSMLKSVINPQKQKLEHLPQAIEEWLDAIASYEKRKDASGNRTKIPEEIKTAALESMLPQDLEAHVQLNQSKFSGFEDLLEEVTRYVEHRTGKTLKAFSTWETRWMFHPLGKSRERAAAKRQSFWEPATTAASRATRLPIAGLQPKAAREATARVQGKVRRRDPASGSNDQETWTEQPEQDESWEQGEWPEDQDWEDWPEETEWKEGNGLLIGGLEEEKKEEKKEGRKEKKEEKKKTEERKKKEEKKEDSAAVSGPSGSGKMSDFGDRLRSAGLDPSQLEGLTDDEANELQGALLASLVALQARAKARAQGPKAAEAKPKEPEPKAKEEPKPEEAKAKEARAKEPKAKESKVKEPKKEEAEKAKPKPKEKEKAKASSGVSPGARLQPIFVCLPALRQDVRTGRGRCLGAQGRRSR
ncbi:ABCG2 [Symbiodinium sp. CCMP2592]|nr:ABCG2 [Symbiodinium sp. CCMP2592]